MSAFLGPIHTWLYKKIKFQNELTEEIVKQMEQQGYGKEIKEQMDRRFGTLEVGVLEDIIDPMNIHGWLQERVSLVENRLAFVVTLLKDECGNLTLMEDISEAYGRKNAIDSGIGVHQAYESMEAMLLNGMPCDHVNTVISEDTNQITWKQNVDIHEKYWSMIGGQVSDYYAIRNALINGLLSQTNIVFREKLDCQYTIIKE